METFNVETPQKFVIICEPNKPMRLEVNGEVQTLIKLLQFAMKHDPHIETVITVASATFDWVKDGIGIRSIHEQ